MVALEIKPEFGYVLGVAAASYLVHTFYMGFGVGAARKKFGIKYPHMYADKDNCSDEKARNTFNCVQRAHQNSLENYPAFLAMLALGGAKYPITAAVGGTVYLLGRIAYFQGYSTGKPDARMRGAFNYIGSLTLLGSVIKFAYDLLASKA